MRAAVVTASTTGRGPVMLVTSPVRVVAPVVPGALPVLRRPCCIMASAFLNAPEGTTLMSRASAKFVISHVPIAPDPPPLTAQLVCTPRLCIKATAYPAVQKATTLTMASAKTVIHPVWLVWVLSPLSAPGVQSPRRDCKSSRFLGPRSPMGNACPSAEPGFTWRALDYVKPVTNPV